MTETDRTYFDVKSSSDAYKAVDRITADDLLLDDYFEKVNSARTSMGRSVLFFWLRTQCATIEALQARRKLIDYFIGHDAARAEAGAILGRIGVQANGSVASLLWLDSGDGYFRYKRHFTALIACEASLLIAAIAIGFPIIIVAILIIVANIAVFLKTTKYIGGYSNSISYLGAAMGRLASIARIDFKDGEAEEFAALPALADMARRMPKGIAIFRGGASMLGDLNSSILFYVKIFLLGELAIYFKYFSFFRKNLEAIRTAYEVIGRIDAAICLADAIRNDASLSPAEIADDGSVGFRGAINPLVENCAPISIDRLGKAIVTGTNMSGKTTLLRTIGINQVLALGIQYAYAENFRTGFYFVHSSIRIEDDLLHGKSRYLVQAKRLLDLIELSQCGRTMLIIDEILTGTNSEDRIAASINILGYLATTGSIVLATTHDIEIAEGIRLDYDPYYFSEAIVGDDLSFDYRIKKGIIDKRNALIILRHLGFSKFIDV